MITAGREGYSVTRNSTFFKKITIANQGNLVSSDDEDEDDCIPTQLQTPNGAMARRTETPPISNSSTHEGHGTIQPRRYPHRMNRRPPRRFSPE
jgi:hypothetical protein